MKRRAWIGWLIVGAAMGGLIDPGSGWGHEIQAHIEWTDAAPPPVVRVAILPLRGDRPLFEQRSVLNRPLHVRLPHVVQGLYLLVVEVLPGELPLVRWVRVRSDDEGAVNVRVRLDRTLLEALRRQAAEYQGAMQMLHRSPLHEGEAEPVPTRWGDPPQARPVNVEVGYWMMVIPQAWNTGATLHATQWQWHWEQRAARLQGYLAGQWLHGQWDRWRGQGELRWTPGDWQEIRLEALYERMEPGGPSFQGGLHHGWLGLEARWRLGSQWSFQVEGRGRSLSGTSADSVWSYWSEVRVDYADTPRTRLFLRGGNGRLMGMDWIPAHAVRQAYWVERFLLTDADFPALTALQWWGALGLHMDVYTHSVSLQFQWRGYDWQWNQSRRRMGGPGLELNSRIRLPVGQLTVDYELTRRTWRSHFLDRFLEGWCHFWTLGYDVRRPPLGQLSVRYYFLRGPVVPWVVVPATSRSLDVEWAREWTPPGWGAQMQVRFVVINLLNQYSDLSVGQPGEYFWIPMPRTWVWSLTTRW
jgi:hypothetical protein